MFVLGLMNNTPALVNERPAKSPQAYVYQEIILFHINSPE